MHSSATVFSGGGAVSAPDRVRDLSGTFGMTRTLISKSPHSPLTLKNAMKKGDCRKGVIAACGSHSTWLLPAQV
jgi:hypothetical protein